MHTCVHTVHAPYGTCIQYMHMVHAHVHAYVHTSAACLLPAAVFMRPYGRPRVEISSSIALNCRRSTCVR